MNVTVPDFDTAATVLAQLRSFSSIRSVSVTQMAEETDETGATHVSFSLVCTYGDNPYLANADPYGDTAAMDQIRAGVQQAVTNTISSAYSSVLVNYSKYVLEYNNDKPAGYATLDDYMEGKFRDTFAAMEQLGRSATGRQVVALRNRPLTAASEAVLLAAILAG